MKNKIMILLFFSSLYSCTSNKWTKSIRDIKFRDEVVFLNMEMLVNSFTYDFRKKTYELYVKSTYEIEFRDLVIEKGRFKIQGNSIELSPQLKLLFNLVELEERKIFIDYETMGSMENLIWVSKDTLSRTENNESGFKQRNLKININNNIVELKEKGRRGVFKPITSSD